MSLLSLQTPPSQRATVDYQPNGTEIRKIGIGPSFLNTQSYGRGFVRVRRCLCRRIGAEEQQAAKGGFKIKFGRRRSATYSREALRTGHAKTRGRLQNFTLTSPILPR
jgi:hypothetical protein